MKKAVAPFHQFILVGAMAMAIAGLVSVNGQFLARTQAAQFHAAGQSSPMPMIMPLPFVPIDPPNDPIQPQRLPPPEHTNVVQNVQDPGTMLQKLFPLPAALPQGPQIGATTPCATSR